MFRHTSRACLLAVVVALVACGGDGGTIQQTADGYQVDSGLAQKGPLQRGAVVTVNELVSTTLAPNGKSYTFETKDDRGTFVPTSKFTNPYLETTAHGYYFNEVTGKSDQWVALRGLSNLSAGADRALNVNVLSDITADRIRGLVNGKPTLSFTAARAQAQRELLNELGIVNGADSLPGGAGQPANFMELDLALSRQADQILAAISGLVSQIGQARRDSGGVTAFLGEVGADLADNGRLDNSIKLGLGVREQLQQAALGIDMAQVAARLNQYYGKTLYHGDDLAQWIDRSGGVNQVIGKYQYAATDVPSGSESRSPVWTAGSDDIGQCISVSGGALYRNGVGQAAPVRAARGDQFALGITAASGPQVQYLLRSAPDARLQCSGQSVPLPLLRYAVTALSQDAIALPADYLGANLPDITDYAYTPVYADLVKQARAFGPIDHPWGGPTDIAPVGSDLWPTGDFGIFLMTRPGMEGTYKASFTGKADVSLSSSYNTTLANMRYDAALNRTTFDVVRGSNADNPGGAHMVLTFKNTQPTAASAKGSGIKDLKVARPGYDPINPPLFTQEFIDHIARFKVLRFMDWLRTNGNPGTTWATRTPPNRPYRTETGVPWEHVIALANQTRKDIWINVPVAADDDYVLQLAQLLKVTLNPDSRIYVEYSNELWNWGFSQFGVNRDLATREVYNDPASKLAYDGKTQPDVITYRRIAKRGKEISDIFRSVYGDAAMMTKVRPVFASQVVQTYLAQLGLEFIDAVYGPPARYFYAFAGAPYFNLGSLQQVDGLSVDAVLQAMTDSVTAMPRQAYFEQNVAFASWYGLPFFAYEGGSDTFGQGSIAAKKAASLDPRLLDICKRYLSSWYAAGGQMFMWYTAGASNWDTQYGTWGLTTDLALTDTPKIQCIDQTRAGLLPTRQARNSVPGSFDALAYLENFPDSAGNYAEASKGQVKWLHPGSHVDYLIHAPRAGSYALTLTAEAARSGNTIDVMLNNRTLAAAFELRANGLGNPLDNAAIPLTLPQGFSTLRIRTVAENGGFVLSRFTVR